MPADRLFHPRLGHSEKVSGLSDFEFRVWVQYEMSADDFGVMRASPIALQADNDSLLERPIRTVQRALDRLAAIHLVGTFQHQGKVYIYQRDWQSYQKVEYPRETTNPKPPADVLAECEENTRRLFELHPGGKEGKERKKNRDELGRKRQTFAEHLGNESQTDSKSDPTTRARACETAKAKAMAQATGSEVQPMDDGRMERLYEHWRVCLLTHARATAPLTPSAKEQQHMMGLLARYRDDALLYRIVEEYVASTDKQVRQAARSLGMCAHWAGEIEGYIRERGAA